MYICLCVCARVCQLNTSAISTKLGTHVTYDPGMNNAEVRPGNQWITQAMIKKMDGRRKAHKQKC